MEPQREHRQLHRIARRHARYDTMAYAFVIDALGYTVDELGRRDRPERERHVCGPELLEGIRRYALELFGPLARTVFQLWGVRRSEDFGAIVFHLVDAQLLSLRETDREEDFASGYDFREALEGAYQVHLPGNLGGAP